MSLVLGNNVIAGQSSTDTIKNSRHLLEPFWSDHILNDLECLRADTFSWQSGEAYVSAYNHLVADIEGKSLETDIIENDMQEIDTTIGIGRRKNIVIFNEDGTIKVLCFS